ncbi:transposable element Tcb2 transposase [Trichonephila clavipes]|uniref:Transposable element Tcb2 transposase n=1 Tax=Trichonephila clavipes TaxID=2585209 RepID=A0A8X6SP77_TRICX|nr:transposable element Tcb2 transposase [Trichonephila clavipes]
MVCESIIADGHTNLHVFDRVSLTGQRYRVEIFASYVRFFYGAYGTNFIFMDDNSRSFRTQVVNEYFQSEGIKRLEWPAMFPDLNLIEHI